MTDILALVAPLADLDSRQWLGITAACVAFVTYSLAMVFLGVWAVRR